jgi:hypothetical protein
MFDELNLMRIFFEYPSQEFHVRSVARQLKLAPATVSKCLKELTRVGFLDIRDEKGKHFYRACVRNGEYKDLKLFYTSWKLRSCGFVHSILKTFGEKSAVILVGKGASSLDDEEEMLQFFIFGEKPHALFDAKRFEHMINRKLEVTVFGKLQDLNEFEQGLLWNGIVLEGKIN